MTKAKAIALGPSGVLAWSAGELAPVIPDLRHELVSVKLDPADFAEWLREPLARYRSHARARASMAERAEVIRWLEAAASAPDSAVADGRLRKLPAWFAEPAVVAAASKAGRQWRDVLATGSSAEIGQVLQAAADALRRQKANRGRPPMRARDELLGAVVGELRRNGAAAGAAEDVAEQILILCSVPAPEASIGRAARRGRRGGISV